MVKSISRIGLEMMFGTALILSGIKFVYNSAKDYPKMLPLSTSGIIIGQESYPYAIESERNYERNMRSLQNYKRKMNLVSIAGLMEMGLGMAIFTNLIENKFIGG